MHFALDAAARLVQSLVGGGEGRMAAGGDDDAADLRAAGLGAGPVGGLVFGGEGGEGPLEMIEGILADALDQRGEGEAGVEQGVAQSALAGAGEGGLEGGGFRLVDVSGGAALEPRDQLFSARPSVVPHGGSRQQPSGAFRTFR